MADDGNRARRSFADRVADMMRATLGGDPQGWFIPYRYRSTVAVPAPAPGVAYPAIAGLFRDARSDFLAVLDRVADCRAGLLAIGADNDTDRPRWRQDWFSGLDAAVMYAQVCHLRPRRIVEIGSGHSTRFILRALADAGVDTDMTAIDPAPRADIAELPIRLVREVVQQAPADVFAALTAGDVLSIDSSHVLMPGSDVDHLLNVVIPMLPAGVAVHIHDMFLPGGYPVEWDLRGYNEQNGIAPLLTGGRLRPLFASRYALDHMPLETAERAGFIPRPVPVMETSLWAETR